MNLSKKYKLLSKLGQGSYGVAYRACLQADSAKIFVIKRVSLANLLPREAVDAIKEAKLLDILNHPNVLEHVRGPAAPLLRMPHAPTMPTMMLSRPRLVTASAAARMRPPSAKARPPIVQSVQFLGCRH